jgi:hypothetical protein
MVAATVALALVPAYSRLYDGCMWKDLNRPVSLDTCLVVCIVGLAAAAHVVPAVISPPGGPVLFGWQLANDVLECLWEGAVDALKEYPGRLVLWYVYLGCVSNPLFWSGVAALLLGNRLSRRTSGTVAGLAGISALVCSLGFLPRFSLVTLLPGFYLWMASIFLLALTGIRQATQRPSQQA